VGARGERAVGAGGVAAAGRGLSRGGQLKTGGLGVFRNVIGSYVSAVTGLPVFAQGIRSARSRFCDVMPTFIRGLHRWLAYQNHQDMHQLLLPA
jgi:hypothetical protein